MMLNPFKANPGVIENLEMANFMQFEGWNASDFSIDFVELSRTMNRVQQNNRLRNFNRLGPSGHIPQVRILSLTVFNCFFKGR